MLIGILVTQYFRPPDQRCLRIAPRVAHDAAEQLQQVAHMDVHSLRPILR